MDKSMNFKAREFLISKYKSQNHKVFPELYMHQLEYVSSILYGMGCHNDNILTAALLRNIMKDTATTYDELKMEFNEQITNLVQELTDIEDAKLPNEEYTRGCFKKMSYEACLIKGTDIWCNLSHVNLSRDQLSRKEFEKLVDPIGSSAMDASSVIADRFGKCPDASLAKLLRNIRWKLHKLINEEACIRAYGHA